MDSSVVASVSCVCFNANSIYCDVTCSFKFNSSIVSKCALSNSLLINLITSLLSVFIEKSLINPNSVLLFKMFVSNDSGFKINNVCKNFLK